MIPRTRLGMTSMSVSQKCYYAIRAVYALAEQGGPEPLKIADIAEHEKIPIRFLEVILSQLKGAGFVQSRRGAEGGYLLARPADKITVGADHAVSRRPDRAGGLCEPVAQEGMRVSRRLPFLRLLGPGPPGDV